MEAENCRKYEDDEDREFCQSVNAWRNIESYKSQTDKANNNQKYCPGFTFLLQKRVSWF